jgi:parvulin-like peptidyl-prolyl isomerase
MFALNCCDFRKTCLSAIFIIAFSIYAVNAQEQNSILATVNGEAITVFDVISDTKEREERLLSIYPAEEAKKEIERLRKNAVEKMIAEMLASEEFKKREYTMPPQVIEDMLDSLALEMTGGDRVKLAEIAEKNGISMNELRKKAEKRAASEIIINEFCSRQISVSPKEIQDYFDEKMKSSSESKVELYAILIKKSAGGSRKDIIEKIAKDLESDNKNIFMTLARLYSETASADKGGYLGWIDKNKLRSEFATAINGLAPGKSKGPVETEEGSYFLFVSAEDDGKMELTGKDMAALKEEIASSKKDLNKKDFIDKLKENAVIRYFF